MKSTIATPPSKDCHALPLVSTTGMRLSLNSAKTLVNKCRYLVLLSKKFPCEWMEHIFKQDIAQEYLLNIAEKFTFVNNWFKAWPWRQLEISTRSTQRYLRPRLKLPSRAGKILITYPIVSLLKENVIYKLLIMLYNDRLSPGMSAVAYILICMEPFAFQYMCA